MTKHRIRQSCPFCSWIYIDVKSQQHYGLWHWAQCCNCGARGPCVQSRRAALTAWNKTLPRTTHGEPKARPAPTRVGSSLARQIATTRADVPPVRLIGGPAA